MSEMIERVARAIAIEWMRDKGGGFPSIVTEEAHRLARAAIEAMREPVLAALENCGGCGEQSDFSAGMDAAVSYAEQNVNRVFDAALTKPSAAAPT